jgi:putative colanic acid biosynthesis acetyltransferase WcaF
MFEKLELSQYNHSFSLKNKIARLLWNICYAFLFRPFVSSFFRIWRIFILRIFGAKIHKKANIYANTKIWAPWNLEMGAYATLGPKVDCYNQGMITIGDNTTISQKSYLCASTHDIKDPKNNLLLKPIIIQDQVWVAADAFVGPGVSIKQGAVVGARSAVFKDIASWSVVNGNPAVFIKKRVLNSD